MEELGWKLGMEWKYSGSKEWRSDVDVVQELR
jgi:hypothetical protein